MAIIRAWRVRWTSKGYHAKIVGVLKCYHFMTMRKVMVIKYPHFWIYLDTLLLLSVNCLKKIYMPWYTFPLGLCKIPMSGHFSTLFKLNVFSSKVLLFKNKTLK